ncbi:MAG: TolC family protein [Gemmataceae bacterium]
MKRLGYRLARWGFAGLPAIGLACSQMPTAGRTNPGPIQLLSSPDTSPAHYPTSPGPASDAAFDVRLSSAPSGYDADHKQPMPVSLDAVLHLAEENNPQIAVARSKVCSAFAEKELAATAWIPEVYLGVGYWRHDGGIQLQQGPLINSDTGAFLAGPQVNATYNPRDHAYKQLAAARQVWQSHGELSKITSEQLLDASTTYIDLLAAHSALAVSRDFDKRLTDLRAKVKKLADVMTTESGRPPADIQVELAQVEGELTTQQLTQQKLQAAGDAASAKLAYLLGVDPAVRLLPVDKQIAAFHVVEAGTPTEALVSQALTNGPGIKELEGILYVIQEGIAKASGAARLLPELNLQMGEGIFGAGPGGTMAYANRFDIGLQARWNVSVLLTAEKKRQVAGAQVAQVQWTYQELKQKLALGVEEARGTILTSGGQFVTAEEQIRRAKEVVELTERRRTQGAAGATYTQIMQARKAVAQAQLSYIDLLREYDKAQLRLMILLGPGAPTPQLPNTPPLQQ